MSSTGSLTDPTWLRRQDTFVTLFAASFGGPFYKVFSQNASWKSFEKYCAPFLWSAPRNTLQMALHRPLYEGVRPAGLEDSRVNRQVQELSAKQVY